MKYIQLPALLLTLLSACAQAGGDPYGLLFTTPDQRARLDNRFSTGAISHDSVTEPGGTGQQLARPLKLNGTFISSSGKKEVWINGESQLAAGENQNNSIRFLEAGKVRIQTSASSQAHDMKPGQILDPNTGSVSEAYQQTSTQQPSTGNIP